MRAALSIAFAGLLLVLPVEQVLAQAEQQEADGVEQSGSPDGAAHHFRVPPLTQNSALLLRTSSDGAVLRPSLSTRDAFDGWSDWSNGKRALVVVGVIVVAYVAVAVIVLGTCGDSCR